MVQIIITRFKYYDETETFNFAPESLTLLKAPSGSGKSTIFEAIYWCLYSSHRKVCPRGMTTTLKNPTQVRLIFPSGMTITRTKPPDVLEVAAFDASKRVLTDEQAQCYINEFFGTKGAFLATSYMRQGCQNPLLELSNSEKVQLLQELTFGRSLEEDATNNPRCYAAKVEENIREVKTELLAAEGKLDGLESCYATQKKACRSYTKLWEENYESTPTKELLAELEAKLIAQEHEISQHKKDLVKLRRSWMNYNTYLNEQKRLQEEEALLSEKEAGIAYSEQQLQAQETWLEASEKRATQEKEKLKLEPTATALEFLTVHGSQVEQIRKELVLFNEHRKLLAEAGFEESSLTAEVEKEILQLQEQIQVLEEQAIVKNKYLLAVKEHALAVKEYTSWEKKARQIENNKQQLAEAKREYEHYFESEEVKMLLHTAELEDANKSNKAILAAHYTARTGFASLSDKLKERLRVAKTASTVLKCPCCEQELALHGASLIPYQKPEDPTPLNNQIKTALKVVANIESKLKQYQESKKLELELEAAPSPPGAAPLAPTLNSEGLDKTRLTKRLRLLQSLRLPELELLPSLQESHTLTELEGLLNYAERSYPAYQSLVAKLEASTLAAEPVPGLSKKNTSKFLTELRLLSKQLTQVRTALKELTPLLEPETTTEAAEKEISSLQEQSKVTTSLIEAGKRVYELEHSEQQIKKNKEKIKKLSERHVNLDRLKTIITDTSSQALEETVASLNKILNDITEVIMGADTQIVVSMFKELKTKDYSKAQLNIQIIRGCGEEASTYEPSELCGGEKSRLTLALTLALSTLGSTPFFFIDEGLASLHSTLRETCITVIREYIPNKVAVNVCHTIDEVGHDEVFTLKEEDI